MRNWTTPLIIVAIAGSVACGKSEAEKQADEAAANAKKAAEAVAEAAKAGGAANQGAEDLAKAMQGMAAALSGGDGKTVEPVGFETLQLALPRVAGWEMESPKGERMTSPVPFSQTETSYTKGDSRIDVKIVDTGFAQLLVAPWSMAMAMGYSKESSDGYEKATTVAGNPGFEKWDKADKRGELNYLVAKRFMVSIEGSDIADTAVLHDVASKIDTSKLK